MTTILIIEDEKDIVETIDYNLKKENFKILTAFDGAKGLKLAQTKKPDLILLDLMLPELSGLEICRTLKKEASTANIPIIMLTAKSEEVDRVLGLELGADDYVTKPFSLRELIARIKTILKRTSKSADDSARSIKIPGLEVDVERHQVLVANKLIELTAKEFALLLYFIKHQGRVIGREKLLDDVWGIDVAIETRTVDVHDKRLRQKLGKKVGQYIHTLRGVGYKLDV